MNFYGTAYLNARNKFVTVLRNNCISIEDAKYWTIKELITSTSVYDIELTGNQSFSVEVEKKSFYKALINEIELFYTKASFQMNALSKFSEKDAPNWNYVTFYYLNFFLAVTMNRFFHRGGVFLKNDITTKLDGLLTLHSTLIGKINSGEYYFNCKEEKDNGNVIIQFTKTSDGTHEHVWNITEEIIRQELKKYANPDEKIIYDQLLSLLKTYDNTFPSQTRNIYNYQPEFALNDISNEIFPYNNNINKFLNRFINLSFNTNDSISKKASSLKYYTTILYSLVSSFYEEYKIRSQQVSIFYKTRNDLFKKQCFLKKIT